MLLVPHGPLQRQIEPFRPLKETCTNGTFPPSSLSLGISSPATFGTLFGSDPGPIRSSSAKRRSDALEALVRTANGYIRHLPPRFFNSYDAAWHDPAKDLRVAVEAVESFWDPELTA